MVSNIAYANVNNAEVQDLFKEGVIYVKENNNGKAIEVFEKITNKYSNIPEPYNNLGVLYVKNGEYDKSIAAFKSAIKINPDYDIAKENLADVYSKLSNRYYRDIYKNNNSDLIKEKINLSESIIKLNTNKTKVNNEKESQDNGNADNVVNTKSTTDENTTTSSINKEISDNELKEVVNQWEKAWENKNLDAYFNIYDNSFISQDGLTKDSWKLERIKKINNAKKIEIYISNIKIEKVKENYEISFMQKYKSNTYLDSTNKKLVINSNKKIIKEENI